MKEKFTAWAINANSDEGHGFIGRYWWFYQNFVAPPIHMAGCAVALFRTREAARKNLSSVKRAFPAAKVERVSVSINTQKLTKRAPDARKSALKKVSSNKKGSTKPARG